MVQDTFLTASNSKSTKEHFITTLTEKRLLNIEIHHALKHIHDSLKVMYNHMKQLPRVNVFSEDLCQENNEWVEYPFQKA